METVYVISMLLSIFCHCMGLFYLPVEASADSCFFIIVVVMFLQKLKLKHCVVDVLQNTESKFLETAALCLAVQVLLLVIWFPIHFTLQLLVDAVCDPFRNGGLSFVFDKIQAYAASVILAMEMTVLISAFEIDDLQRFFGTKDDLVSDTILTIVSKQQKVVQRREKLLQRM